MEAIRNIEANYQTTYIPGHASIWYNETADLLAGATEPIGHILLYSSYVRNRTRETATANPHPPKTWWSFSRKNSTDKSSGQGGLGAKSFDVNEECRMQAGEEGGGGVSRGKAK